MKLVTGKVVGGKIEFEGEPLKEGATVTILANDDSETFELSAEQETELARRIEAVERGRSIDGEELLRELAGG
jgi:hypothetical protein